MKKIIYLLGVIFLAIIIYIKCVIHSSSRCQAYTARMAQCHLYYRRACFIGGFRFWSTQDWNKAF